MPAATPVGRAVPIVLSLSVALVATTVTSAPEVAGQGGGGRSGDGRGARRALTAIAASMGRQPGAESLVCSASFGPSLGARHAALQGVALTPNGAWGVGFERLRDSTRRPVVVRKTQSGWLDIDARSGGDEDGLVAVAAHGKTLAWAVGFTTVGSVPQPLAMRWDGDGWRVDRPSGPRGLASVLTDVAIVNGGTPWAVGYRFTENGERRPVVVRRERRRWRDLTPRIGPRESVTLTGVARDGRGGLWVVGHGGAGTLTGPVAYRRGRGDWQRLPMPRVRGEGVLTDVIAAGRDDAWAVGYQQVGPIMRPLVLRWDGRRWERFEAPRFGSQQAMLSAVTLAPGGSVWVVGSRWNEASRSHEAAAASWDGRTWNEVAGSEGGTELHDVAGAPDAGGWAVGRSGLDARVTRVCWQPHADLFEDTEPLPDGPAEVDTILAEHDPDELSEELSDVEEGADRDAASVGTFLARKRQLRGRFARIRHLRRIHPLPGAGPSTAVVARDVAARVGVAESTATYGALSVDFDGNGQPDLYIGRHGRPGRILLNEDGRFTEHTAIVFPRADRHGCAATDLDGSGLPDLYCATGASRGSGLKANELWLDPGSPDPVEAARATGVQDPTGRGRDTAFLRSGRRGIDLVVTNSPVRVDGLPSIGKTFRWRNDGTFQLRERPGFAAGLGSLSLQAADIDGDRRDDLLLVAGGAQAPRAAGTRVYRNTEDGLTDVTRRLGVRAIDEVDAMLADVNGDGRLDLVQLSDTRLRVSLMHRGRFRTVYERLLTEGRALAAGDADGDRREDIYIVRGDSSNNPADVLLLSRRGGWSYESMLIPQARGGDGDDAVGIDHDGNGLTDFLVLNGRARAGPVQLIAFYPRD